MLTLYDSSSAISKDANLMVNLQAIINEGVITNNTCNTLSTEELTQLFQEKLQNLNLAYQEARSVLEKEEAVEQKSLFYGERLLVAERSVLSLHNIKRVIAKNNPDLVVDSLLEQISDADKKLSEMTNSLPLGPSRLLPSDLQKYQSISSIPRNKTYEFNGQIYYEPQISLTGLSAIFTPMIQQGKYGGITSCRFSEKLYNLILKQPFSYVALRKSPAQRAQDLAQLRAGNISDNKDYPGLMIRAGVACWNYAKSPIIWTVKRV